MCTYLCYSPVCVLVALFLCRYSCLVSLYVLLFHYNKIHRERQSIFDLLTVKTKYPEILKPRWTDPIIELYRLPQTRTWTAAILDRLHHARTCITAKLEFHRLPTLRILKSTKCSNNKQTKENLFMSKIFLVASPTILTFKYSGVK